jgi:transcriptional regulator with XRE-family HTH domain
LAKRSTGLQAGAGAENALQERVGRNIRAARNSAGLSQTDVANATGTVTSHISAIERGAQNLTLRKLAQIAGVVGTTPEALFADPLAGGTAAPDQLPATPVLRVADVATAAAALVRHIEIAPEAERDAPLTRDSVQALLSVFLVALR